MSAAPAAAAFSASLGLSARLRPVGMEKAAPKEPAERTQCFLGEKSAWKARPGVHVCSREFLGVENLNIKSSLRPHQKPLLRETPCNNNKAHAREVRQGDAPGAHDFVLLQIRRLARSTAVRCLADAHDPLSAQRSGEWQRRNVDDYYIKSICPSGGHGRGHRLAIQNRAEARNVPLIVNANSTLHRPACEKMGLEVSDSSLGFQSGSWILDFDSGFWCTDCWCTDPLLKDGFLTILTQYRLRRDGSVCPWDMACGLAIRRLYTVNDGNLGSLACWRRLRSVTNIIKRMARLVLAVYRDKRQRYGSLE